MLIKAFAGISALMLPLAASAQDNNQCDMIAAYLIDTSIQIPFDVDLPAKCSNSIAIGGGQSRDCAWEFGYRSDEARSVFQTIKTALSKCARPIELDGPNVSHPDSYVLERFAMDTGVLSVSLKDKAALSRTYVFLRVETVSN